MGSSSCFTTSSSDYSEFFSGTGSLNALKEALIAPLSLSEARVLHREAPDVRPERRLRLHNRRHRSRKSQAHIRRQPSCRGQQSITGDTKLGPKLQIKFLIFGYLPLFVHLGGHKFAKGRHLHFIAFFLITLTFNLLWPALAAILDLYFLAVARLGSKFSTHFFFAVVSKLNRL